MLGRTGQVVAAGALLGLFGAFLFVTGAPQALLTSTGFGPAGAGSDPSDAATLAASAPDGLFDTPGGLVAGSLVAAGSANRPVPIADVIDGYRRSDATEVPGILRTIRPILGCMPTKPMPGSVVGHATSGQSDMPIGMTTYGDLHLAEAVKAYVAAYRRAGPEAEITLAGPRFEVYDVAVTETAAPVYLVLESAAGDRIWNIHAAEGVQIERVILLGGTQAGVANLDPVVPVEVILSPGLAECGIVPAYAPSPGQIADASDSPGQQPMTESDLGDALDQAQRYDTWFRDSFGVRAGESRVGYDWGAFSVIGPVPPEGTPRPVWAAIAGAEVRTTQDLFLDLDGQTGPGEDFTGRVLALVTEFARGDLESLQLGGSY